MIEFLTTAVEGTTILHLLLIFAMGATIGTNFGMYLMIRMDRKLDEKYGDYK
jgi:hypothetical protein